ncbi:redoxin domain-containing protein [candidate division WOR-3 bacterium]|nr:redoxin domain-containing protein [candidate division WOR-3 bacterium]
MKRIFKPFLVVLLMLLVMTTGTFAKKKKDEKTEEENGWVSVPDEEQVATGFVLTTLDGKELSDVDLLGMPVVLDFFGVACGPCHNALLFTQKMVDEYGSQAWIYAVDAWNDTPEQIQELWANLVLDIPVLTADQTVLDKFAIDAVPTYCVLDQQGELVEKLVGYSEDNEKALEKRLSKLVRKNGDLADITEPVEEPVDESEPLVAGTLSEEEPIVVAESESTPGVTAEEEMEAGEEEVQAAGSTGETQAVEGEPESQSPVNVEVIIHNYPQQPFAQPTPVIMTSPPSSASGQPSTHSTAPVIISPQPGYQGAQVAQQTVPVIISPGQSSYPGQGYYSTEPPAGTVPVVISPGSYATGYTGYSSTYGTYGYPVQPSGGLLYFHTEETGGQTSYGTGIYGGTSSGIYSTQPQGYPYYSTSETYGYGTSGAYGGYQQPSLLTFHELPEDASQPTWFVVYFEPASSSLDYSDMVVIQSAAVILKENPGATAQLFSFSTDRSVAEKRLQAVAGALISYGVSSGKLAIYNTSGSGSYTSLRGVEIYVQAGTVEAQPESEHKVKPPTTK